MIIRIDHKKNSEDFLPAVFLCPCHSALTAAAHISARSTFLHPAPPLSAPAPPLFLCPAPSLRPDLSVPCSQTNHNTFFLTLSPPRQPPPPTSHRRTVALSPRIFSLRHPFLPPPDTANPASNAGLFPYNQPHRIILFIRAVRRHPHFFASDELPAHNRRRPKPCSNY